MNIIIRVLTPNDAEAYRKLRTKALTGNDRRYYYVDPDKELAQDWRASCTETCEKAIIGIFKNDCLVGNVSIHRWNEDPTGRTAYFRAIYVLPELRHTSITKELCAAHDRWAKEHGYERAVFAIRADNLKWIELQGKNGAESFAEEPMCFADGSIANVIWFQKTLGQNVATSSKLLVATYS